MTIKRRQPRREWPEQDMSDVLQGPVAELRAAALEAEGKGVNIDAFAWVIVVTDDKRGRELANRLLQVRFDAPSPHPNLQSAALFAVPLADAARVLADAWYDVGALRESYPPKTLRLVVLHDGGIGMCQTPLVEPRCVMSQ